MNGPNNALSGADFQRIFATLGEFSPAQASLLLAALDRMLVGAGAPVIVPGNTGDSLYLICSGRVRVTLETDRVVVSLGEFGVGHWFGEMAVIDPAPATATVRAVEECTLLALSHDRFMALRRSHPEISSILLQTFCHHLTGRLRETLQNLGPKDATSEHRGWLLDAVRRLLGVAARTTT